METAVAVRGRGRRREKRAVIEEHRFYCLSCNRILPATPSARLFQTGYYQCLMRLGLCAGCLSESGGSADSQARFGETKTAGP